MSLINALSSTPINSLSGFSQMTFEECAKNIHKICRASLRDYARVIEVFREIEDKEADQAHRAKAQSYRSVVPMVMRVGSILFGALNIGFGICPQAAKHSYDWLSDKCPLFPQNIFNGFIKPGTGFDYMDFEKFLSQKLSVGDGLCRTGLDINSNYEQADRTEIDALIQKTRELGDRRAREAHERRSESDELLQLLQQMNREIADAIRTIARS